MSGVTFDTGALMAVERGSRRMIALLAEIQASGSRIAVPACVLAQAWRGGPRQARVARLLATPFVEIVPLDEISARAVGVVCARSGVRDVTEASVVLCARERGHAVVTSDFGDIRRIDPSLRLYSPD